MRALPLWAGLAALVLAGGVRAQDTYAIKFKHAPDAGKSVAIKNHEKGTTTVKVTDPDGKVINNNKEESETDEVYTEKVLEKGDKVSKKFQRTYEKATRTVGDKKSDLPYQGRTIVFELKDGKYEATAEGTPALPAMVLEGLAKKENTDPQAADEAILPKKAVKVGDKWAVDIKAMAKALANEGGLEVDADKSKGDVTLTKAYTKDGAQYGVLDITMKLAIKSVGGLKFDTPATGDLTIKLDVAIDGKSPAGTETSKNNFKGMAVMEQMGKKFTIDLSVDTDGTKTVSPEK
jgi:hypothetical protein